MASETRFIANQTLRPNAMPGSLGVDLQGLDPALDGIAIRAHQIPAPPSGILLLLVPPNGACTSRSPARFMRPECRIDVVARRARTLSVR